MFRSNSTSSEASNFSIGIKYEMEDESQENRNYESTNFVYSQATQSVCVVKLVTTFSKFYMTLYEKF